MKMQALLFITAILWVQNFGTQFGVNFLDATKEPWAASDYYQNAPYDFFNPEKSYEMPDILREISGIALAGPHQIFCVQDELGTVFQYDLQKRAITREIKFTNEGDFEDIFIKKDSVYVLRSDGTVFSFSHLHAEGNAREVTVPLNCPDVEGICYNARENTVYFACKDHLNDDNEEKRVIYAASPTQITHPKMAFKIDLNEMKKLVMERFPSIEEEDIKFNPSAIAIHPRTNEKYVLSSRKRFLAIFNEGGLKDLYPLPKSIYRQPEGMAFTASGDLYISSEGKKNGHGQIMFLRAK